MDIFKVSTFTLSLWILSVGVELTVKGEPLCDRDCCENCSMWMWIKLCCDESLLASSQQTWQGRGLHHELSSFWPGPGTQCTSQGQWSLWSCSLSPPAAHWLLVIGLCLVCSVLCAGKQQNAVNTPSSAINNTDPSPGNILRHPASRAGPGAVIMHYAHYGHVDPVAVHQCFIAF